MRTLRILGLLALLVAICSRQAKATYHEWKIDQAYSNASGTVQYVDFLLTNSTDDEQFLSNAQFNSGVHSMGFTNLPSPPVNGQRCKSHDRTSRRLSYSVRHGIPARPVCGTRSRH